MDRKDFTKLPSTEELKDILAIEAQRDLLPEKEDKHYPDFTSMIELLDRFNLRYDIFSKDYDPETLEKYDIAEEGKKLIEQLKEKILSLKKVLEKDRKLFNAAYDYLSKEDKIEKADLIFVFGSKTPLRILRAVDLYKSGFSDLLIISGGNPFYEKENKISEAKRYKGIALEAGISEEDIITEDKSITIPDNVRSSLNLLDKKGVSYKSIILINSPYVQRRGWAHFKKYLPESVKLIRVNSETADKYQRDNWYKNSEGISVIANEFIKMKIAVMLNTA